MPYKLTITDWDGKAIEQRSFDSRKALIISLKTDIPDDWVVMDGSELKQARKNWGIKAYVLADMLGVTRGMVSQWEHGRKPISERQLRKIYDLFKKLEEQRQSKLERLVNWFRR